MATKVSLTTERDVGQWLDDKPRDWAVILAARTALRVLPLVFRLHADDRDSAVMVVLSACRASIVAWTAGRSTEYAHALAAADYAYTYAYAYAAATRAAPVPVAAAAARAALAAAAASRAAADAARADAAGGAAASRASAAARAAADAVVAADPSASDPAVHLWSALSADAAWLLDREDLAQGADLLRQPLWLVEVRGSRQFKVNLPIWARVPLDEFAESEWANPGPWGVWVAWYRWLLPGITNVESGRFRDQRLFEVASQGKAFWERDPHRVTASIAALLGWTWDEAHWVWPEEFRDKPSDSSLGGKGGQGEGPNPSTHPDPEPAQIEVDFEGQSETPPIEVVTIHSDEATAIDQLNRWPFAKALVEHLDDVCTGYGLDGFAVHVHAPWGAGKTSVLEMMKRMMEADDRGAKGGGAAPQWVVVNFNAWRNERRNPPWWPLLNEVRAASQARLRRLDPFAALALGRYWVWWRLTRDLLPLVVAALVVALSVIALSYTWDWSNWQSILETGLKLITAVAAVVVSFVGASQFAVFGSGTNAKLYEDLSQDPLKRVTRLFSRIVATTKRPICIFIDDLDRCRPDYVVALLQGVQTIFRHSRVAYVVAADRAWIRSSFESQYGAFGGNIGNPGQPLGYLFLEKVFQVSTPLPGIGQKTRAVYWDALLKNRVTRLPDAGANDGSAVNPNNLTPSLSEILVEQKRAEIRRSEPNLTREIAEKRLKVSNTAEDRAAIALELSGSAAAEAEATHLLAQFKDIVPDIPRVMKRMINAFAIRQAIGILEENAVTSIALARWTMLEQVYPVLADMLIEHPEWINAVGKDIDALADISVSMKTILSSKSVTGIIGTGDAALTAEDVRRITRGATDNPE